MIEEDIDDGNLETALRYASQLIPLADARPSTCVSWCRYNPITANIIFHLRSGDIVTYDCGVEEWAEFKLNVVASAGEFFNDLKQRYATEHPQPPTGPTRRIR